MNNANKFTLITNINKYINNGIIDKKYLELFEVKIAIHFLNENKDDIIINKFGKLELN